MFFLNANYLLAKLRDLYELPFDRTVMHEVVFSAKKRLGASALDISKRLLDYGNVLHEEKSDSVFQTGYLDWSKLQNRIIRKSSKGANKSIIESSLIRTQKIV